MLPPIAPDRARTLVTGMARTHVLVVGDAMLDKFIAGRVTRISPEAPVPVVVMAVEEAASRAHLPPRQIWRNVAKLAESLSVHRRALWA